MYMYTILAIIVYTNKSFVQLKLERSCKQYSLNSSLILTIQLENVNQEKLYTELINTYLKLKLT